jgi:hypothetical protein
VTKRDVRPRTSRFNRWAIAWLFIAGTVLAFIGWLRNLDDPEGALGVLLWYVLPAFVAAGVAYPGRDRHWGAAAGLALSLVAVYLALIALIGLIYLPAVVLFAAALLGRSRSDLRVGAGDGVAG